MKVIFEFRKGLLFIRLKGILNKETGYEFDKKLKDLIIEKGIKYFVINLEKLKYIDNDGFNILKNRYKDMIIHDSKLIICNYHDNLYKDKIDSSFMDCYKIDNELEAFKLINI